MSEMGYTKRMPTSEEEEEALVDLQILNYVFGFVEIAAIKCAIELRIADVLENHKSPMTLFELSSTLGCESDPSFLHRIMRFLVRRRIFGEEPTSYGCMGYVQTPLSRRLMASGENSMVALFLVENSPIMLAPWHFLSARVLENRMSCFESSNGEDLWKYGQANPSHSKLFNNAMSCIARMTIAAIISDCPEVFDGLTSLVDVGGGDGTALSMLVKAWPSIRGINYDLGHVVSEAPAYTGVKHVSGDMFHRIPKADAAFLMWVLHDWGDDESINILRNCRAAIPKDGGKVIIVEAVIEEDDGDKLKDISFMMDLVMIAHTSTGKERTLEEWGHILKKAGFSRYTVKPIRDFRSVIEAYP